MWAAVQALADDRADAGALRLHRLELVAARRAREAGRRPPAPLVADERRAAAVALAAPVLLGHMRASTDRPLLVMKGPEAALAWPDPGLRPYVDLDVLTDDSRTVQRELLAAGFEHATDPSASAGEHHLFPLHWPGLPLTIEVHHQPNWPRSLGAPPSFVELMERARASHLGVPELLAPDFASHALLLAAHAWVHTPLGKVGELVDVMALARRAEPRDIEIAARRWGLLRLWRAIARAGQDLFGGSSTSLALRAWGRHLPGVRERTVLETHAARWLAPAWGTPLRLVPRAARGVARDELLPLEGEPWRTKLTRTRRALRHAALAGSVHACTLTTDHPKGRTQ